jgi:hypothetical protein
MPKNSVERMNNLAESLIRRSGTARLPWELANEDGRSFVLRGEAGSIVVTSRQASGEHPYSMYLVDQTGKTVESVQTLPGEVYHSWETRIASLYGIARSTALRADEVVADFEAEFGLEPVNIPADDDVNLF